MLALTPTQQGMLFHTRLLPGSGVDIEQIVCRLDDEALDVLAFERAWQATLARHDALRLRFAWDGLDDPAQQVCDAVALPLRHEDWRDAPAGEQAARLDRLLHDERQRGFDPSQAPLMRVVLVRSGERAWLCVWTVHHIVCDGRSFPLVLGEVFGRCDAAREGRPYTPPASRSFADHVRHVAALDGAGAQAFWRERLAGFTTPTALPGMALPASARGHVEQVLPEALDAQLRAFAQTHALSVNTVLQGAWAVLLERFSGESDIVFGATRSGRGSSVADAASIVGCLINTLPVRVAVEGGAGVVEWLQRLQQRERAVRPFEQSSLLSIQAWSEVSASGGEGRHLFDSLIVHDHASLDAQMKAQGAAFAQRRFELVERTHYPLTLYTWAEPRLTLKLAHDEPRFSAALARRLVGGLARLLEGMVAQPHATLDQLSALTHDDERALRRSWNDTAVPVAAGCIHHAFEAQAARTPQATALVCGEASIPYDELNRRANRLAFRLLGLGVMPGVPVGVCVSRSVEMVVALLAIHKAGGAYLPLDPAYPRERLRYMLDDAAAPVLVTQRRHAGLAAGRSTRLVLLDDDADLDGPEHDPRSAVQPDDLAYVIYTSGSTGKPKGTLVEHRQVVNFFAGMDARVPPSAAGGQGTWLAVTSIAFDISVLELLWTLTRGWRVVLQPEAASVSLAAAVHEHAARPIDFSLMYFSSASTAGDDKYKLLLDGAKFADANGFAAVWTPERHFHDFGGLYPNPAVTSAALAAVTKRIALRSGSVVAALHHPARIAEEWAVVDNLSGGRVGLSFAAGWQPRDFVLAPEAFDNVRGALRPTVETVRRLWRGESVSFAGAHGQQHELRTWPRPLQRELPVWLTAAGSPQTFRDAGEIGAGVLTHLLGQTHDELAEKIALYRRAWREAGHAGQGHVTLMLHSFVGDDTEAVRETVRAPMTAYLKSSLGLVKGFAAAWTAFKKRADGTTAAVADVDIESLSAEDLEGLLAFSFERYFESSGLFGDEARALAIVDRIKGLGVDEIACLIDFGVDEDTTLAHLQHLARVRERAQPPVRSDDASIARAIERHGVTHLQCTPSLASALAHEPAALSALARLDALLLGGEALPPPLAATLQQAGVKRLFNLYGPTETTIWSSTHELGSDEPGATVPIGTPIANTVLHVLDARGRLVPPGVAGELHIGGAGVVRGYLDRPELTAGRFVPDTIDGAGRLYRTGDLVRRRDDGVLEFVGRIDHQVKIRGHRIELGEIEAALAAHASVREAVVIAREDMPGELQLVAYVIAAEGAPPDAQVLRTHLRQRLPEAMVPSHVVTLAQWPQTPNRKIDRKALPAPQAVSVVPAAQDERVATAAAGDIEHRIAAVWQEVLHLPQVALDANFFDLGGHSLLAVKAHRQLVAVLDLPTLAITDLFRFPTVRTLAAHLRGGRAAPSAAAAADRVAQRREAMAARRGARPQRPAA